MRRNLVTLGALLMAGTVVGCGEGLPETAPASGVVHYNGNPVRGASVTFQPEKGKPANGVTDEEGRFTLTTFKEGDGAVVGTHRVSIVAISVVPPDEEGGNLAPDVVNEPIEDDYRIESTPIPEKYADPATSGLTQTVEAGEENEFKIELTD